MQDLNGKREIYNANHGNMHKNERKSERLYESSSLMRELQYNGDIIAWISYPWRAL